MQKGIIGKKVGMTQLFDENANIVPVTIVQAGPCVVVQKKTVERDGYDAIQLGYDDASVKRTKKPQKGHFDKADAGYKKVLREFKFSESNLEIGDIIKADTFEAGDVIDVVGVSKGKGYAGPVKRWGVRTLKRSHGTGPVARHMGAIGAAASPAKVFKGRKMAGQLGAERVTVQNLKVVKVDAENNLIAIKGAVPGPKGGIVTLFDAVKNV
ncbi:MAG: 50S ribosomal protein L3 [Ruminococcaceae bacterium]|nr:50S ribosomal protein L3 [Oscillospiraceae bacterium]